MQPRYAGDVALHFHELVHVAQWSILGAKKFIERYIAEIQNHGYDNAPLERMAYGLQDHFSGKKGALDVFGYVQQKI